MIYHLKLHVSYDVSDLLLVDYKLELHVSYDLIKFDPSRY